MGWIWPKARSFTTFCIKLCGPKGALNISVQWLMTN